MSDKTVAKSDVLMTNVRGYFNPNTYPINLSISELNISVQLKPMEFVLDRIGNRKINDPILDRYVGKMLKPELSKSPVPIIAIPRMPPPQASLHVVGQGVRDGSGKWVMAPPNPNPPQELAKVAPSVNKPSVLAMSIEEARRRGFIGRVKLVDDNYGAAETDGAPSRGDAIPRIKYAMESRAPLAQPGQLPQELVDQVAPTVAPIIAGLQKAAQSDPEAVNLSRKAAEQAMAEQRGDEGVKQFRTEHKAIKASRMPTATIPPAPQAAPAPTIVATPGPRRRVAQVVHPVAAPTEPQQAVPTAPIAQESPLVGGRPGGLPAPIFEEDGEGVDGQPEAGPTAADQQKGPVICGACGKEFEYPSYLVRHIHRKHKDRIAELLPH